jgi:hypothetical protein
VAATSSDEADITALGEAVIYSTSPSVAHTMPGILPRLPIHPAFERAGILAWPGWNWIRGARLKGLGRCHGSVRTIGAGAAIALVILKTSHFTTTIDACPQSVVSPISTLFGFITPSFKDWS